MNLWAAEVDRMLEEQEKLKEQDTFAYIASRVANFVECLTTSTERVIGKVKPKKSRNIVSRGVGSPPLPVGENSPPQFSPPWVFEN